jgi:hypothetical protein
MQVLENRKDVGVNFILWRSAAHRMGVANPAQQREAFAAQIDFPVTEDFR